MIALKRALHDQPFDYTIHSAALREALAAEDSPASQPAPEPVTATVN